MNFAPSTSLTHLPRIELDPQLRCRILGSSFVHICPSPSSPKIPVTSLPDPSALQMTKWSRLRN
ncbi:hypothetical protein K435DRAFT_132681 [Dendrothele bispora CBS 962.96]|uniref:Uncharacterized protein n=1 Tax=Dendrothele bispora (strain CBS 962.96) TaxID=1314807 RepID=A0A4S8M0C7_DENBC|nr:hypothetical protein K435DRAFT_132681 [Dendrothele bispora CBS 962.96]